jgi:glycosyltransferase involved in cell wall biosynthesis
MPSLTEAFGVVFLEAMAAGVPVVGSRVGGIPEVIEDQVSGVLAEPEDAAALSAAISACLARAGEFRRAGLLRVAQFSVERMMACTYAAYAAALGRSSAS